MKFKVRVRSIGDTDDGWWEDYDKPGTDAEKIANGIIEFYNGTISPPDRQRELLEVVVVDGTKATVTHDWKKVNSVSQMHRGRIYDIYRCKNCGITGKRFGLDHIVVLDSQYKAALYHNCAATQKHLKTKHERAGRAIRAIPDKGEASES